MPGFWSQNVQNAGATSSSPYLRDFIHANKTFLTDGYALAPKLKFLFHVYFDINSSVYDVGLQTGQNFGLAVKTVKLPSFSFENKELNQYNRKRIVQTKIKYSPVNMTFHDDNSNMMTRLWEAYYLYNYSDGSNFSSVFNGTRGTFVAPNVYNYRNIYQQDISDNSNWGYQAEGSGGALVKPPFFKNITIFGFNRHTFTAYTLINPLINSFNHDTYNYSDGGGTMEMNMDLDYETIVYNEGAIDGRTPDQIVQGFGNVSNYDRRLSPITPNGSNSLAPGPGGYRDASGGYTNR